MKNMQQRLHRPGAKDRSIARSVSLVMVILTFAGATPAEAEAPTCDNVPQQVENECTKVMSLLDCEGEDCEAPDPCENPEDCEVPDPCPELEECLPDPCLITVLCQPPPDPCENPENCEIPNPCENPEDCEVDQCEISVLCEPPPDPCENPEDCEIDQCQVLPALCEPLPDPCDLVICGVPGPPGLIPEIDFYFGNQKKSAPLGTPTEFNGAVATATIVPWAGESSITSVGIAGDEARTNIEVVFLVRATNAHNLVGVGFEDKIATGMVATSGGEFIIHVELRSVGIDDMVLGPFPCSFSGISLIGGEGNYRNLVASIGDLRQDQTDYFFQGTAEFGHSVTGIDGELRFVIDTCTSGLMSFEVDIPWYIKSVYAEIFDYQISANKLPSRPFNSIIGRIETNIGGWDMGVDVGFDGGWGGILDGSVGLPLVGQEPLDATFRQMDRLEFKYKHGGKPYIEISDVDFLPMDGGFLDIKLGVLDVKVTKPVFNELFYDNDDLLGGGDETVLTGNCALAFGGTVRECNG